MLSVARAPAPDAFCYGSINGQLPHTPSGQRRHDDCYMNFTPPGHQAWTRCKSTLSTALEHVEEGTHRMSRSVSFIGDNKALMAEQESIELQQSPQQSNSNNLPTQRPVIRTESDAPEEYKDKMDPPGGEELDLLDRDPTSLNTHVRVGFEEVFAEPYDMHSFDGVWEGSYIIFINVKFWCYRILSALCGIPFAICWGVYFACLTFCHIWYVVPFLRGWVIALHYVSRLWAICIRTFCDPFFESLGKIFSGFRIYMNRT